MSEFKGQSGKHKLVLSSSQFDQLRHGPKNFRTAIACLKGVESRCDAVALGSNISVSAPLFGGAHWVRPCPRFHTPLIGRVEDWRAGRPLDRATFPVPSTSHAACGFPALRAPICFTPPLMGPSCWGNFRPVASHSIGVKQPSSVVQPPPIPSFPAEALSFLSKSSEPPGRFSLRLDV